MIVRVVISSEENRQILGVEDGHIYSLELDDYVAAVVASEVGNAHIEACKAQAIAARTFVWPLAVSDKPISDLSTKAQSFRIARLKNDSYPNAASAAKDTSGMVLCYNDKPIDSCPYSASNGGNVVSSKERWGGERAW